MKIIKIALFISLLTPAFASLKFGAFNIRNYSYDNRANVHTNKKLLVQIINAMKYDFFSVEEIVEKEDFIKLMKENFPFYEVVLSECGGGSSQKLGFVYNKNKFIMKWKHEEDALSVTKPNQQPSCNQGSRPAMMAQFVINSPRREHFVAIALHLKAGGNSQSINKRYFQFATLSKILTKLRGKYGPYVIMGDLNTTEYIKGAANPFHQKFNKFVEAHDLVNLTEDVGCSSYWWGGVNDGLEYPSQLDHVLMSESLVRELGNKYISQKASHCKALSCKPAAPQVLGKTYIEVSDHCPISAAF